MRDERFLRADEPLAGATVGAIRGGDVDALGRLLQDHPGLAGVRLRVEDDAGRERITRTLLHVATDWPGHFPNVGATMRVLVAAGAAVDARNDPGTETPLHWAASGDDIEALDALVDAGADIEAPGAVIAGGTPLDDAVAFGQWQAARRLVEHGARMALWHAAALGLRDRVEAHFAGETSPAPVVYPWGASSETPPDELTVAFWCACHGGQPSTAEYLVGRGANLNWVSVWDGLTPLDAARREGADDLATWLVTCGARSAEELTSGDDGGEGP
ncbi:MAG: ankyrin repeat domain-containing protein [Acidimicrobiales bacterium]